MQKTVHARYGALRSIRFEDVDGHVHWVGPLPNRTALHLIYALRRAGFTTATLWDGTKEVHV